MRAVLDFESDRWTHVGHNRIGNPVVKSHRTDRRSFDKYESYGAYHWKESDRWSKTFNPPLVARYQVVSDRVGDASRILEVGAGDGCLTARLTRAGANVIGVEVDDTAVKLAAKALRGIDDCAIAHADCYQLPFGSKAFDLVVMADVIEHLDDPNSALRETARVLKPDGFLIMTTPKWRPDRVWDVHHVHEYTSAEIDECLKGYFNSVELRYFWPLIWSRIYSTKIGWRALRIYARYFPNPFLKVGSKEDTFGQILAICRKPSIDAQQNTDNSS